MKDDKFEIGDLCLRYGELSLILNVFSKGDLNFECFGNYDETFERRAYKIVKFESNEDMFIYEEGLDEL